MAPGVFKDPVARNPDRCYKMIYKRGRGVGIAFSRDGIHWVKGPDRDVIATSDSPNSVLWDARLLKYVAHTRHNQPNAATGEGQRQVLQSESDDFINWRTHGIIMKPDDADPPWNRQFYNMEWMPYEDVYFGFISVYHILPGMQPKITPGAPWMDKVDIQLTFSRNGRTWTRAGQRQVFIPYSCVPDAFDQAMIYVMQHPIVVDDEIWIYYVGFSGLHWATRRAEPQGGAVGLAKLRLDGFISIDAGDGSVTTKPLTMSGDRLIVNADASNGSLQVEVLGGDGLPLPGFGREQANPIVNDGVRQTVEWQGGSEVSNLAGQPIRLRFNLNRCKLYSFRFLGNLER